MCIYIHIIFAHIHSIDLETFPDLPLTPRPPAPSGAPPSRSRRNCSSSALGFRGATARKPFEASWGYRYRYGGFQKLGALFGSPYNKSPTILGSILRPPIVGNSHIDVATDSDIDVDTNMAASIHWGPLNGDLGILERVWG